MAARNPIPRQPASQIEDLRRFAAGDLGPLLEEEIAAWRDELEWDFTKSADLVRRFVDLRALNGAVFTEGGTVAGYVYYVMEENKGLIGDLYVRRELRSVERENALLRHALEAMRANPAIRRVEAQMMMLLFKAGRPTPLASNVTAFLRNFMRLDLRQTSLGEGPIGRPFSIEKWSDFYQETTAQLIATAYAGHVDSRINDQYRTPFGARRFLHNIVQYPGCGSFYRPASFAAFDAPGGRLRGVSLASLVAPDCGHITQICVSPGARGQGAGHELLRQSLTALRNMGCRSATLTVTAANEGAVRLYESIGFRTVRRFTAFVWENF
jgi:ribosomal protein S18 acetylase RimI-like enzyme